MFLLNLHILFSISGAFTDVPCALMYLHTIADAVFSACRHKNGNNGAAHLEHTASVNV